MGWFSKKESSITIAPGAVNIDTQARNHNGVLSLNQAKHKLGLSQEQDLREETVWRIASTDCESLQGKDYWLGTLEPKGDTIAISVGGKQVGTVGNRWLPSGVKILKRHGGRRAECVIAQSANRWTIYVDMG